MKHAPRMAALIAFLVFFSFHAAYSRSASSILFVGTYTKGESKGIYAFRYAAGSGKLTPLGLAAETVNPSFLAADSTNRFLYAVNETDEYKGQASGAVTAFEIHRETGRLVKLDQVASRGAGPCYISFDRTGKYVLVANYTGGNLAVFPLSADGRIQEASAVEQDKGSFGPNQGRQERAHAHWVQVSADNRLAYVADLGLDRVLAYGFDAAKGEMGRGGSGEEGVFSATLAPGTGPRHAAFSADEKFMYVLGELDSTVTVFENNGKGSWRSLEKTSALPEGFSGHNDAAEIAIHPSGKFLYTSNRGDDSIAVFRIDRSSGKLTLIQRLSSGGKTPRNFALDPAGRRLVAANEDGGNIVEFTIDDSNGKLSASGETARVPWPVCLVFVPE
ncbi:MAG: lactonase family protein [Acidobacteria bacterium]|nr:lactonase family protein [Acidobacteriota bacterium]